MHHVNNVDLAVLAFPVEGCECPPIYSQVLLSRDFPLGLKVDLNASTLTGLGVDWRWWDYEKWDSYVPGAWSAAPQGRYYGQVLAPNEEVMREEMVKEERMMNEKRMKNKGLVKEYMMAHPASCFKLMVGTGILVALDRGLLTLEDPAIVNITQFADTESPRFVWNGTIDSAFQAMITVSDNSATTALLDALHRTDILSPIWDPNVNQLAALFESLGLHLLKLEGTQKGGYWGYHTADQRNRSSDLDTTGFFHMGAFDTVKLLWLLNPHAPYPPDYLVYGLPQQNSQSR